MGRRRAQAPPDPAPGRRSPRSMGCTKDRWVRWGVIGACSLLLMTAVGLATCGCLPRHPIESAALLLDLAAADGDSWLKRSTPAPQRRSVRYAKGGNDYRADVYVPRVPSRAGLLLLPGAAEAGKDDPRLVAFATSLARMRFTVLVAEMAGLRELRLSADAVPELVAAIEYLAANPQWSPQGGTGVAGISYALGPAILAAREPGVRGRVRFIVGVGGYHDLVAVVTFFTTGYFRDRTRPDRPWRHLEPNSYGKWVFVLSNVERLQDVSDRSILETMARRKMTDANASIEDLAQRLGPEGRSYYELLENRDPLRTPALLQRLPREVLAEIERLDLTHYDLSKMTAQVLLFHGRDDTIIPFTESLALKQAVAPGRGRLFLLDGLAHVDLQDVGWRDGLRLWCGVDALLRQRARAD